jgi:gingipain R
MKFTFTFTFIISVFIAFNQKNFNIDSQTQNEINISFKLENKTLIYRELNGFDFVDFSKMFSVTTLEKGSPALPSFGETFIIPSKGLSKISIVDSEFEDFQNISVLPSKGNLKRNIKPDDVPYFFGEAYTKNQFYPENPVHLVAPFNLRTIRGQVIRVLPYQYNPITKTLRVYRNIKLKLTTNVEETGINELSSEANPSDLKSFQEIFSNPSQDKYLAVEESGELLVISPEEYVASIQGLIDWKNQKGIKTVLKTTTETGTTTVSIKDFITTYYNSNPNLKYILLIGDSDKIPAYSYGTTWSEELYSDSYYGQLVGNDYYPELFVGRLSGVSTDIDIMVDRILEYETNPKIGDWTTKAIGLASSEGAGFGDENQADWQHMRGLREQMLTFGYTDIYEFYDGNRGGEDLDGSPSSQSILDAVNTGVSLFNYTGHGDLNTCITGNFSSNHINQATNNGMYPFVISVACNNGTFIDANCLAETWVRAKQNNLPTGAIGVCASSILMAWAPPMQTQDEMTLINTKTYIDNQKATLGGLFYNAQMSMLEEYDEAGEEVMQTWVMFGDPTVELRNKITQNLEVEHVEEINPNTSITELFESITEDAIVTLSVNNEILTKGTINSGSIQLSIPSQNSNTIISVVATKQNYKPYIGQILVKSLAETSENNSAQFSIFPNPVKDELKLNLNKNVDNYNLNIVDLSGKIIETKEISGNSTISVRNLKKGMYFIEIQVEGKVFVDKFIKE